MNNQTEYRQPSIFDAGISTQESQKRAAAQLLATRLDQLFSEVGPLQGGFDLKREAAQLKSVEELVMQGKITREEWEQRRAVFERQKQRQERAIQRFMQIISDLGGAKHDLKPQIIKNAIGDLVRHYGLTYAQKHELYRKLKLFGT